MNDILTRLQNGESADAIAAEFTKALNDASAKYEAEKKKSTKIKDMRAVVDAFNQYVNTHYPDTEIAKVEITDADIADMVETMDSFIQLGISISTILRAPAKTIPAGKRAITSVKEAPAIDFDSIFNSFYGRCAK